LNMFPSHDPTDKDLLDELKEYADDNDIKLTAVRNNDDLLNAATLLFSSVLAYKAIKLIGYKLSIELTNTAQIGREAYSIKNNKLGIEVIDELLDGVRWSDRIWTHQAQLKSDMYRIMKKTLLNNDVATGYTKELRDKYGVFNYQADRILRTEGARVSSRQQLHDIKQAGFDKIEWIASAGACVHCAPLDGKVFPADKFGDDPYVLPKHPSCRCSVAAAE